MDAFPRLASSELADPIESFVGKYKDICTRCPFTNICIKGCNQSHKHCVQRVCHRSCNHCSAATDAGSFAPGICGKSPILNLYASRLKTEGFRFKQRDEIKLKSKAIAIHCGRLGGERGDLVPPEAEALAVLLDYVWSPHRGWFSEDLRDYLQVNTNTRLILISHCVDHFLYEAFENEVHKEPEKLRDLGFNNWELYSFSSLGQHGRAVNIWLGYLAAMAGESSQSHFMQLPPAQLRLDDSEILEPWLRWSAATKQATLNWQFINTKGSAVQWRWLVANSRLLLKRLPAIKSLWFVGVGSPPIAYNISLSFPEYACYFLSSDPWLRAKHGRLYGVHGKGATRVSLSRREILLHNQRAYAKLIDEAVFAASSSLADAARV